MEEFNEYIDNYFKMDVSCSNFKLNYNQPMPLNEYEYIQSFMGFYNIISEKLPEIPLEISLILSEKNETVYKSLKKILDNSVFSNSNKKVDNTPLDILYNDIFENNINMYDDTDTEDTEDTITKKEIKQVNLGLKTGRRKTIKNNEIIIGIYTASQRQEKIKRYREKRERAKLRGNEKVIIYKCRKVFADSRPRVGGRFVPIKKK